MGQNGPWHFCYSCYCIKKNKINISQEELFVATKRFIVLRDLKIIASKSDPFTPYEDNAIIVHYVPLVSNKFSNENRSMSEK